MLKRIVLEKIYLLLTIFAIGGYSAMCMLTTEHSSIYIAEDPIPLKVLIGMLFILTSCYIIANRNQFKFNKIGRILLFISIYMAITRVISLPPTAGFLSYIYQPMRDLLIVMLFIFSYTIYSKSEELYNFFTTGMLIAMMITAFYYYQNWTFANEIDEAHLGTSYYTLFILPTILFSPRKWIKYIAIAITGVVIISSFKRGGLIALVLGVIAYLFVKEVLFEHKVTKLILFVIIVITLFIVLIYIDNAMGNIISQRILNIQEDGGSGRDQVWATTWTMIRRSSPEHLIFGHGYNAVLNDSPLGLSAHNDFLEVLYNYGIVCFVPYIFLYLRLIQQIFAAIKLEDHRSFIMAFTCVVFILISMISHVIVYPWAALIALSWGFMSAPHSNNNIA